MGKVRKKITRAMKIKAIADEAARVKGWKEEAARLIDIIDRDDAEAKLVAAAKQVVPDDADEGSHLDLCDLLSEAAVRDERFCTSAYYVEWERNVAEPELRNKGYIPVGWRNGDADSFGPLVRLVDLVKDGIRQTYFYG